MPISSIMLWRLSHTPKTAVNLFALFSFWLKTNVRRLYARKAYKIYGGGDGTVYEPDLECLFRRST